MASADDIALFDEGQDAIDAEDARQAVPVRAAKGKASVDDLAMFDASAKDPRFVDDTPAETRPLKNTGADLAGQFGRDKAALGTPVADKIAAALNGVGTMATNAADSATVGAYSAARNAIAERIAPQAAAQTEGAESAFNQDHPLLASTSRAAGYFVPGAAPARLAEGVGAGLRVATDAAPGIAARVLASRPVAGALTGAGVSGGTTLAEDVTSGAPIGDALSDAGRSALVGGVLGGTVGAVQSGVSKAAEGAGQRVADRFREKIGEKTGVKNTRGIAKKADEIDSLVERHPVLEKLADKPKEFVGKAEDIAAAKGEQARALLDHADKNKGGGIRLGSMLDSIEAVAGPYGEPGTVGVQDALLRKKAAMIRGWGNDPDKLIPSYKVRRFASDLQAEGFNHKTETDSATAAKEASKTILDHVNQHVTGMDHATGRASADATAQRYYQLNDDLTALARAKAAMQAKLDKPPGERANRLSSIVRAATHASAIGMSAASHSPLPMLGSAALYGYPKVAALADRALARGLPDASALGRAALTTGAPAMASREEADRELARRLQAQRAQVQP
ncbi:MAG: hypothetical protein ABJA82_00580 [Myxococcales bacterium]